MNLAKTSAPTQDACKQKPSDLAQNDDWKRKNIGSIKRYKGRLFSQCLYHNMHTIHKLSDCFLNPSHTQYEEKQKARKDIASISENSKNTLEMNLMNNDDYVPINPQITLASSNTQLTTNLPEIRPAIETNYLNAGYPSN